MKHFSGGKDDYSFEFSSNMHDHGDNGHRQKRASSEVTDDFDLFAIPKLLKGLNTSKFGSVGKEIEALCARRLQILKYDTFMKPKSPNVDVPIRLCEKSSPKEVQVNQISQDNAIEFKCGHHLVDIVAAASPVVVHSLDDEDNGVRRHTDLCVKVGLKEPPSSVAVKISMVQDGLENSIQKAEEVNPGQSETGMNNNTNFAPAEVEVIQEDNLQLFAGKKASDQIETEDERLTDIGSESLKGNVECVDPKIDNQIHNYEYGNAENDIVVDDDLSHLWSEMAVALGSSKDAAEDPSTNEQAKDEGCEHSLILKDDIGYVCRICGFIQMAIESIFEFSYDKGKRSTRTYVSESQNTSHRERTKILPSGIKTSIEELMATEISAHPRHMKQMKPHQVEGFNFLCSNLTTENPGGCILAHAPGSGKTFMIISFMQTFLARSPHVRPLVVLPKGILGTWKKEFQTWQVEDIPLYDFYTVKADNRAQQLAILRKWVEHKSILFLGYKQFSTIICDNGTEAADCQEILLKVPTILVLDEGHTPRNEETDVLQSLARVQTPLKVVLSGTLYQNHVKEVFNILNLVRPKFLKSQNSRAIVRRIMCRVPMSHMKNQSKSGSDSTFFDLVEKALQQKDDFKMKAAVIQDLREMTSKVLHYYKGDFLDELPGHVDFTLILNLSPRQKSEVEKLKQLYHFKRTAVGSLLYVHPQLKYFSEKYPSNGEKGSSIDEEKMDNMVKRLIVRDGAKAKFFLNILNLCQLANEKLLVFSQYILPLKLFERLSIMLNGWSRDKELFMITGDSSHEHREWSMERFNNSPDAKVFFGSIKACGEGISLVGASRIIILDVHLNPSVTRQAIGRAFRPGQKRKVYTYRLVAADSPEEEDHNTCFRKELISKMWFEWNENCLNQQFEMKAVDVNECGDRFLESPSLREDVKALYKR